MASERRKASWLKHDAQRKATERRKLQEAARYVVRHKLQIKRTGYCSTCQKHAPTVWHHPNYELPSYVIELCHKCHRKEHPRKMPNGAIV